MPKRTRQTNAYEDKRQATIKANAAKLKEMGIAPVVPAKPPTRKKKKATISTAPAAGARRSSRQRAVVDYTEPSDLSSRALQQLDKQSSSASGGPLPQPKFAYNPDAPTTQVKPSYDTSEGKRDKNGKLTFSDYPDFKPNLTPKQVMAAGAFGGCYFNPKGGKPGILHPQGIPNVGHSEFPKAWWKGLDKSLYCSRRYKIPTNKYGVKAGQDQAAWERSGWINPQDPRGWFQWYCRFFCGRRSEDDERQIGRWSRCTGDKGRWKNILCNKIARSNKKFDDASVSPVIRQTLLHWAFELTDHDFQQHLKRM